MTEFADVARPMTWDQADSETEEVSGPGSDLMEDPDMPRETADPPPDYFWEEDE